MIASMTGYGHGECAKGGISVTVELRSVNSRFLEVSTRLPRTLSLRENEIKELIRKKVGRGKITMVASVERDQNGDLPLKINASAAKAYYKLLNQLRKTVKLKETVKLDHLLRFSEVIETRESENSDEKEWQTFLKALDGAIAGLVTMRQKEGGELKADFKHRIALLEKNLTSIQTLSLGQVPAERQRLRDRIAQLMEKTALDEGRLEMEVALLADRLDVTEECVRFRSHNKFFLEALDNEEAAGRKLNFLVQEMNREANTIGSKSTEPQIAHLVVGMKEELERIREQLQNIE